MKAEDTIKMAQDSLSTGLIGIIYGSLFNADPIVAACAFTTAAVARHAFAYLIKNYFGQTSDYKIVAAIMSVVGLSAVEIVAFRHFNLIARRGTIILGAFYMCCTIITLDKVQVALRRQALIESQSSL